MTNCFLVSVNFALVAKDVAATLQQHDMGKPLIAATQPEAIAKLQALPQDHILRIAVVQMQPDLYAASPLNAILKSLGVPVVLLVDGPVPQTVDQICPVLPLPFFTEDLERALTTLACPSQQRPVRG